MMGPEPHPIQVSIDDLETITNVTMSKVAFLPKFQLQLLNIQPFFDL